MEMLHQTIWLARIEIRDESDNCNWEHSRTFRAGMRAVVSNSFWKVQNVAVIIWLEKTGIQKIFCGIFLIKCQIDFVIDNCENSRYQSKIRHNIVTGSPHRTCCRACGYSSCKDYRSFDKRYQQCFGNVHTHHYCWSHARRLSVESS